MADTNSTPNPPNRKPAPVPVAVDSRNSDNYHSDSPWKTLKPKPQVEHSEDSPAHRLGRGSYRARTRAENEVDRIVFYYRDYIARYDDYSKTPDAGLWEHAVREYLHACFAMPNVTRHDKIKEIIAMNSGALNEQVFIDIFSDMKREVKARQENAQMVKEETRAADMSDQQQSFNTSPNVAAANHAAGLAGIGKPSPEAKAEMIRVASVAQELNGWIARGYTKDTVFAVLNKYAYPEEDKQADFRQAQDVFLSVERIREIMQHHWDDVQSPEAQARIAADNAESKREFEESFGAKASADEAQDWPGFEHDKQAEAEEKKSGKTGHWSETENRAFFKWATDTMEYYGLRFPSVDQFVYTGLDLYYKDENRSDEHKSLKTFKGTRAEAQKELSTFAAECLRNDISSDFMAAKGGVTKQDFMRIANNHPNLAAALEAGMTPAQIRAYLKADIERIKTSTETAPEAPQTNDTPIAPTVTPATQSEAPSAPVNVIPLFKQIVTLTGLPVTDIGKRMNAHFPDSAYEPIPSGVMKGKTDLSFEYVRDRFDEVFGPHGFGWKIEPHPVLGKVEYIEDMRKSREGREYSKFVVMLVCHVLKYRIVLPDGTMQWEEASVLSDSDENEDKGYAFRGAFTSLLKQFLRAFGGMNHILRGEYTHIEAQRNAAKSGKRAS